MGTFLSIDGRTNFVFMVMWGVLGVAWIRLLLPQLLKLINLIPWNWRYGVTAVCAALMLLDGVMTIQSIDCWYGRMAVSYTHLDEELYRFGEDTIC